MSYWTQGGQSFCPLCYYKSYLCTILQFVNNLTQDCSVTWPHHINITGDVPGSPVVKPPPKSQTKGKWLKITRKGLLVSAIGRMGKEPYPLPTTTAREFLLLVVFLLLSIVWSSPTFFDISLYILHLFLSYLVSCVHHKREPYEPPTRWTERCIFLISLLKTTAYFTLLKLIKIMCLVSLKLLCWQLAHNRYYYTAFLYSPLCQCTSVYNTSLHTVSSSKKR